MSATVRTTGIPGRIPGPPGGFCKILTIALVLSPLIDVRAQVDTLTLPEPFDLQFLVAEALMNNPDLQAARAQMDVMEARVPQARAFDDPQIRYMREDWSDGVYTNIELSQAVRFPTKLAAQGALAEIQAAHAHHDHLEKINEVVARLKKAFFELWFVQQNLVLLRDNERLLGQFSVIAQTRYRVGDAAQQDVLKADVEIRKLTNDKISFRQRESSTRAMIMALLNRQEKDTLGIAVIPEEISRLAPLDSLLQFAMENRSMLQHDSLSIDENRAALSLAKQEFLPDVNLSLERAFIPTTGFQGWRFRVGLTLPFAPWSLGKANGRVDEANAAIMRAEAAYSSSRAMVRSSVKDLYYKAESGRRQLDGYRGSILPRARQALEAGEATYRAGKGDFLVLIDSYRTLIDLTKDYFMARLSYEQTLADLEQTIGTHNILAPQ